MAEATSAAGGDSKRVLKTKLYFNEYVAGRIRTREDFEAINCDLLYFCMLMKMNQYAKEVYFLRKAPRENVQAELVQKHLKLMRRFVLDFYEVEEPNWALIQDEFKDSLEDLDRLPVNGSDDKKVSDLGSLAEQCLPQREVSTGESDLEKSLPDPLQEDP
jgi:hypothetical protein